MSEEKKLLQDTGDNVEETSKIIRNSEELETGISGVMPQNIEEEENDTQNLDSERDYEPLSMEELVEELKKLTQCGKLQSVRQQIEDIRYEFDRKYKATLEEKKEEFLSDGGDEIDFSYQNPIRKIFYDLFNEYRKKREQYRKEQEKRLQANLARKQDIIEEIKNLVNTDIENINETYNKFKLLQGQWQQIGSVPRTNYNDLWNNYQHHVDRFYDFLELNRDLRDMDFKHNLEEKRKIIEKAEMLAKESDAVRAFRELQLLHKIWKEDLGPVAKEYRDDIWQRFQEATSKIRMAREQYIKNMEEIFENNAVAKNEITQKIKKLTNNEFSTHKQWQRAMKEFEGLKDDFFKVGKVPSNVKEEVWLQFKEAVSDFNRKRNIFYKNFKKELQQNIDKKNELIEIAKANKDSNDWEVVTPLMKKIQKDWNKIGSVPRKYSEKMWEEFKEYCNHYFDRMHAAQNIKQSEALEVFEQKKALLDQIKEFQLTGNKDEDLLILQQYTEKWDNYGKTHTTSKRSIENKFTKILEALYKKLGFEKQEVELIRYNSKLERITNENDEQSFYQEMIFVRRKIDEIRAEVLQLENNLQFFSNVDKSNPMVSEVVKNIDNQKEKLSIWISKLKQLQQLQADREHHSEQEIHSQE